MGVARGEVTNEEFKEYTGVDISLLNLENDETGSDGRYQISGSGTVSWTIAWDANGFSGYSWNVGDYNTALGFDVAYESGGDPAVEAIFRQPGNEDVAVNMSYAMTTSYFFTKNGCGGLTGTPEV